MNSKNNFSEYDKYYNVLQNALSTVQSKDAGLDEVIKALEEGVKAHEELDKIIKVAEERVQKIIDEKTGGR